MKENTEECLKEFLKGNKSADEIISNSIPNKNIPKTESKEKIPVVENVVEDIKPVEKKVEPVIETKIIEKVIVKEEIVPNQTLLELSQILKDLKLSMEIIEGNVKNLESGTDTIKECVVEIMNETLRGNKIFKEKLKNNLNASTKKQIKFIRDDDNKIISAELLEEKIKSGESE